MNIDFSKSFKQYEALVEQVDGVFEKVRGDFAGEVTCKTGCSDCCSALFDVSMVEAAYINHQFNKVFEGKERDAILERANKSDRKIHQIKKQAQKDVKAGMKDVEILSKMSVQRVRCPLLNEEDLCVLYKHRPITCRIYGIPSSTGGMSHTCGQSGFEEGKPYPSVNMDTIYKRLVQISSELVADIKSRHVQMADMLVPVSMALLTDFDADYLGVKIEAKPEESAKGADDE